MSPSPKLKSKAKKSPARKTILRKNPKRTSKQVKSLPKKNTARSKATTAPPSPRSTPVIRAEDWAAVWHASLSGNEDEEEWLSGKI